MKDQTRRRRDVEAAINMSKRLVTDRLPRLPRPRRGPGAHRRSADLILIADDSLDTRELYASHLAHRGFNVLTAEDGEAAIQIALALRPDVIVMDLSMPRLNGISAINRLKHNPRTRRIPVIMLTGYPHPATQQGALDAGAAVFLTKPCLPEDLEREMRQILAEVSRDGE